MLFKTVSGGQFSSESYNFYGSDISRERLETQFTILKMHGQESSIASVSSNAIASFSETATVLVKLVAMPAINALSERSYSALTRIKNYLRSTQNPECMQMILPLPHLQKTLVSLNIK